jgi:hypothetical protein
LTSQFSPEATGAGLITVLALLIEPSRPLAMSSAVIAATKRIRTAIRSIENSSEQAVPDGLNLLKI